MNNLATVYFACCATHAYRDILYSVVLQRDIQYALLVLLFLWLCIHTDSHLISQGKGIDIVDITVSVSTYSRNKALTVLLTFSEHCGSSYMQASHP
jgi:hypothetical protein